MCLCLFCTMFAFSKMGSHLETCVCDTLCVCTYMYIMFIYIYIHTYIYIYTYM